MTYYPNRKKQVVIFGFMCSSDGGRCNKQQAIHKIKGQDIPKEAVKSVLLKLDDENISYVDMCLSESKTAIKNMQSYILTALYCSQHGGDTYFNQLVKHDYA